MDRKRRTAKLLLGYVAGGALIAFFAIIAISSLHRHQVRGIVETADASPTPLMCTYNGEIGENESIFTVLTSAGVSPVYVDKIKNGLSGIFDFRRLRVGDRFSLRYTRDGKMMDFVLHRSLWENYRVICRGDSVIGECDTSSLEYHIRSARGVVENTLWESMVKAGIPPKGIMNFADILSYDFDFVTDTRNGHKFRVLYEEYTYRGKPVRIGRVLLAEYGAGEKVYTALFYRSPDEKEGYYNLKGESTKRSLLKSPLHYTRISSYFTHRRYHPILKIYRPHLGVDYAAPSGTPVVASGSGRVIYAGKKGGFGNFVKIKHPNNIMTSYGHFSRIAKGIRVGKWVNEGDVIGYVGMTGLATGPHLDYRVQVKGKYVNPLKYAFPTGPPVPKAYMDDFLATSDDYRRVARLLDYANKKDEYVQVSP